MSENEIQQLDTFIKSRNEKIRKIDKKIKLHKIFSHFILMIGIMAILLNTSVLIHKFSYFRILLLILVIYFNIRLIQTYKRIDNLYKEYKDNEVEVRNSLILIKISFEEDTKIKKIRIP